LVLVWFSCSLLDHIENGTDNNDHYYRYYKSNDLSDTLQKRAAGHFTKLHKYNVPIKRFS